MKKIYLLKNLDLQFIVRAFSDYQTAYAAMAWYKMNSPSYSYIVVETALDDFGLDFYSK